MSKPLKAVVIGGTGAVGREVVGQLLASAKWGSVVTVGRREAEVPATYSSQAGYDASKLKQHVVDMDRLEEQARDAFAGADSVFCCLGTTRGVAGSADHFRKVDRDYVAATAKAAKAAGAPHFALVSAQGARANVWASDLKPLHGLLYMKTKGQAEELVKGQGFPCTTILRPGMLERGDLARGMEKVFMKLVASVSVSKVASVMISEAEKFHNRHTSGAGEPVVSVLEMGDIQKYAG